MTERDKQIEALQEKFEDREDDSEKLDDLVIDAACSIGSAVNNGGVAAQIEFLIENGFTTKEIEEAFDG